MNFKSESDSREYALINCLEILRKDLNAINMCDKVFRIYEERTFDRMNGKEITKFCINEIPVEIQHLTIPNHKEISLLPRKYTLKERMKILLKGEV